MNIAFFLSMPNSPSWNGKWSGEGRKYVKTVKFTKKQLENAEKILKGGGYSYSWPDGWRAFVRVEEVTPTQSKQLTKTSDGFCGYEWMITSIIKHGYITAD